MSEYQIEVKAWMLKPSTPDFDFMAKYNNDIPMPLMIMYTGGKLDETKKMIKVHLHGDIKQRVTLRCMCCGRPITNKVSQYFGIGPICGEHNYTNPFDTEEELDNAVSAYRTKLVNTVWTGWLPISAIVAIDDISDPDEIRKIIDDMPIEIDDTPVPCTSDTTKPVNPNKVITARIDKPVRGTDDFSAFLTFKYNKEIVDVVKSIRNGARFWNPDEKQWEIDYKELGWLKAELPDYTFNIENEDIVPAKTEISDDYTFKTKPMSHQIAGVQYGLDHSRWLLADDQGLGKTKQLIDLALIRKHNDGIKHCLIICGVNPLKWNWLEEISKHSNETGYVLGQYTMKKSGKLNVGGNAAKLDDLNKVGNDAEIDSHYFLITNVETLRDTKIAEKLKELCDTGVIGMVAIDEIHRCKSLQTQQGQGMLQLQPYYRVAMTGTPLINTPLDLYAILKWLGYEPYSFKSFKYHFCEFDAWGSVVGYKNINQLREQLDAVMLRRTKKEVLDLPEKIYTNEYVELTEEQRKLYNQIITDAINAKEDEFADDKECILATLLKLRQVSGGIGQYNFIKKNPKLDRLEQIVEEAVYSGTKVIIYSNWIEGIKPAIERLQKYNPVVITGETKDSDRQSIVNKFQNDDSVKVILGTTGALGTGLTLTAATEVIFLDNPWNNATKEQACDRAHRIGTTSAVTIHTIMAHGTYEENVQEIIDGKRELSDTIVERKDLAKLKIA